MDLMETDVRSIFPSVNQTPVSIEALVLNVLVLGQAVTVHKDLKVINVRETWISANQTPVSMEALVLTAMDP